MLLRQEEKNVHSLLFKDMSLRKDSRCHYKYY